MPISWKVEIINPCDNKILKTYEDKSVQNIVKRWNEECNNNYLTSTKIFNIYHHRKKHGLIRVYKYDTKVSDSLSDSLSEDSE
tara:strand:- start:2868 stop:3116 length:249 start_codon:yes stop_codon:yes gene_type:complete